MIARADSLRPKTSPSTISAKSRFGGFRPTLSFERSYATAPEPPIRLRQRPRYYHRWAIEPAHAPWATWARVGEPIAEWTDIDLPLLTGIAAFVFGRQRRERPTQRAGLMAVEYFVLAVVIFALVGGD